MELVKLSILANFATAAAYTWIPIAVFLYLQKHSIGIPEWASGWPRLGGMFVFACGVHHFAMVEHLTHEDMIGVWHALFDVFMAVVSVLAALEVRPFLRQVDQKVKIEFLEFDSNDGNP